MDEDEHFEKLLEEFQVELDIRGRSLDAQMLEAKRILESEDHGLRRTNDVRHTPISARLKDKAKALRTLRRRQEDRKRLRELKKYVEAREPGSWEQYCKEWNMEDKKDEAEPFQTLDDMFHAMHDLAGIRISIYFPNDIPNVISFLEDNFIVEKPSRKGGIARDFQKIRKLVERQRQLRESDAPEPKADDIGSVPQSTFDGYRAMHVVIRHKPNRLDFDKYVRGENLANIEVQIGSIIMHAWSDIEHDILYKPSQGGEASPDVVRMLDLINGIVMTGEVALQQLASVAAAEATRQAQDRQQKSHNWQYLVPWLDKYCATRNLARPREWKMIYPLFYVLRATDEHTFGRVEQLLDEIGPQQEHPQERLPALMLHHLGKDTYPFRDRGFEPQNLATTWNARYWATCLVNTINLSIFTNSFRALYDRIYQDWEDPNSKAVWEKRPYFADFLDLLHPTKPRRRTDGHDAMISFCKHLLSIQFSREVEWYALLPMKLASAGYTVRPRLSDEEEKSIADSNEPPPVFIPAYLQRFTWESWAPFAVVVSTINEDLRLTGDLYFTPRRETEDDRVWKTVLRDEYKSVVACTEFHHDVTLTFEDKPLRNFVHDLVQVLEIKVEPELTYNEVESLYAMARELNLLNNAEEISLLFKRTREMGIVDAGKYQEKYFESK
ncbi:hypothetical protein B0I35DRAFT_465236 [Stachybotrys elegans]|uniref:RelA/SpoT domain-containing protein n=1 Tax=Stachybotrys elegans TaxID=80388 RepID=A0A8K0WKD1_9HYPO|nr:hypothetical protein B0I35DRAFT_465236 [Stachybotrys elegans]